jgi:hypothetical protein
VSSYTWTPTTPDVKQRARWLVHMDDGRHYAATFHPADDPDAQGWHLQAYDAEGSFVTSWWYVSFDACKRFVEQIESTRMNTNGNAPGRR